MVPCVIGAGALGIEYLKMLSLMGFSTGQGHIQLADDEDVKVSHLQRQFMYR
jgi:molybdopterin/thiamine biosynthesis adenylyltransferase